MESPRIHVAPRGFTLIEMLVVVAIIVIITAVVINGQSNFNQSLTITDSAYTVALSIREAQTFGLSSRTSSGTNKAGYGARFVIGAPRGYTIFADVQSVLSQPSWCPITHTGLPDDKPGNCLFDSTTETTQNYSFSRGFYISKICGHGYLSPSTLYCSTDSSSPLTAVDMVFLRPNTDSIITGTFSNGSMLQLNDATIILSAPNGEGSRAVCLSFAGQVSIATSTCP